MNTVNDTNSQNLFLKSLPDDDYLRISPHLELHEHCLGEKLYSSGENIEYVHFPDTSVASIVTNLENGASVETGIIGREGIIGTEIILSEDTSLREVNIQFAGKCFRLKAEIFKAQFEHRAVFRKLVLCYVGSYLTQIAQNAACLAFHEIEQRLSRWLLMFHDRTDGDEVKITHEFIALTLGVHRPSISKNANRLQEKGFIRYYRGKISILDRQGLENCACECYRVNKNCQTPHFQTENRKINRENNPLY